jgi:hypothetical protein
MSCSQSNNKKTGTKTYTFTGRNAAGAGQPGSITVTWQ